MASFAILTEEEELKVFSRRLRLSFGKKGQETPRMKEIVYWSTDWRHFVDQWTLSVWSDQSISNATLKQPNRHGQCPCISEVCCLVNEPGHPSARPSVRRLVVVCRDTELVHAHLTQSGRLAEAYLWMLVEFLLFLSFSSSQIESSTRDLKTWTNMQIVTIHCTALSTFSSPSSSPPTDRSKWLLVLNKDQNWLSLFVRWLYLPACLLACLLRLDDK